MLFSLLKSVIGSRRARSLRKSRFRSSLKLENLESRDVFSVTLEGGIWGASQGAVDVAADLKFSFSEPVQAGDTGGIHLYRSSGTLVETFGTQANPHVIFEGATVRINPTWDLDGSSQYYLTIDPESITSLTNVPFEGVSDTASLSFTSGYETQNVHGASFIRDEFPGTASESIGDHRVLYIRATYQDVNRLPNLLSYAQDDMDLTSRAFIENSRGRMPVTVTYTPLVTLPFTRKWLDKFDTSINGLGLIQSAARAEARKLGFDDSLFDVGIVRVDEGLRSGASWGGGDSVWLGWSGFSVITHEGGHALGLGHAHSTDWDGNESEYGNQLDWMGNGGGLEDVFGVNTQAALGWIDSSDRLANPGPGIYRVSATDSSRQVAGEVYGVTQSIPSDVLGLSPTYTLEYRPRQGSDLVESAVLLRNGSVIDLTPGSSGGFKDGGVRLGQTYQIPGSQTFFSVLGQQSGSIDIAYQQGPFADNVAPQARMQLSATKVKRFDSIDFTAEALDANGDQLIYSWVFSDGVVGSGATFRRSFIQSAAQDLTVELRVSDLRGGLGTVSTTVSVAAASTSTPATIGSLTPISLSESRVAIIATDAFAGEGGDSGLVTIRRIGTTLENPLEVQLTYSGSAYTAGDLSGLPSTVTIPAGQSSIDVPFTPMDDSAVEVPKSLIVSLAPNASYAISSQNVSATIQVSDNDTPLVSITAIDSLASEPTDQGRNLGVFEVRRSGPTSLPLTVYYGVSGTAFNGGDFGRLDGKVVIPAGQSAVSIFINPIDDEVGEREETVILALASFNDSYSVGAESQASVTLQDNHDLATVSVRASGSRTNEGGAATFTFEALGSADQDFVVHYTVGGTASNGQDYTAIPGTVTIPAGAERRSVNLTIQSVVDGLNENDESVTVTLTTISTSQYHVGLDGFAQVSIADAIDMTVGGDRVSVSRHFPNSSDFNDAAEDGTGHNVFWLYRENSSAARGAINVTFSLTGTATPGSDYSGTVKSATGTVLSSFTPGAENTVTIPADADGVLVYLTPLADSTFEGTESVVFTLMSAAGAQPFYPLGINSAVTRDLLDSNAGPVTVEFGSASSLVSESSTTAHGLMVKLNQASSDEVTVKYRVAGGAAIGLGADYSFQGPGEKPSAEAFGTVTFAPGETSKVLPIWLFSDRIDEGQESVRIELFAPQGATLKSGFNSHLVTVYDVVPEGLIKEERWAGNTAFNTQAWDTLPVNYVGYLSGLTTAQNVANSYSRRLTGTIVAPTTGAYEFYLAGDDEGRLYLSSDSSPANKSLIASHSSWTNFQQWDKYSSQKSAVIQLVAGQSYYIEVQQVEVGGGDHVSVGWKRPGDAAITPVTADTSLRSVINRYVGFTTANTEVKEGQAAQIAVSLDRVNPHSTVSVDVAILPAGNATAGSDFNLGTTSLIFAPGELTKYISVAALVDDSNEPLERVSLRLVNAQGAQLTNPIDHTVLLRDINEPALTSTTGLASRTQEAGGILSQLTAVPAPGRTLQSWQIVRGNPRLEADNTPAFSIDGQGRVILANPAALPLGNYEIQLTVRGTDNLGSSSLAVATVVINGRQVVEERWSGMDSYWLDDWSNKPTHSAYLTSFDAPRDVADHYSRRITGIFTPPTSGEYSFWIAARDEARLTIAPAADPENETALAWSPDVAYQNWDANDRQQSPPQQLVAGERYVLRAYQVENYWGDHLSVAWAGPGISRQVMPASAFLPAMPERVVDETQVLLDVPGSVTNFSIASTAITDSGMVPSISAGELTRDPTLGLSGTADAGSLVTIYDDSLALGTVTATAAGTWNFTTANLADGVHWMRAEVLDKFGNLALTAPVSFIVRTAIDVVNLDLISRAIDTTSGTTSGEAVAAVVGFEESDQGVAVYRSAAGALLAVDNKTGDLQIVTRSPSSPTVAATATVTTAGLSPGGRFVVFGSNDVTSFGAEGSSFIDNNDLRSGPSSDLFSFDRQTGNVSLLTADATLTTSRSRQAEYVGITSDGTQAIFTTDFVENIGEFTAPGKPQPTEWVAVDGGFPTTSGKTKTTSLRVADIDPTQFTFQLSGGWITNKPLTATVGSGAGISRGTGTLSFWIQGLDSTTTKAVKLELSDVSTGILVKATAAKYVSGNQPNQNWNTSGTSASVATSSSASGYGVATFKAQGTALTDRMKAESAVASKDVIAVNLLTGSQQLLSHSAAIGNSESQAANVANVRLAGDGRHVVFTAANASKLGNSGVSFTDTAPSTADLFATDLQTGQIRLLSRSVADSNASAGVSLTLHDVSAKSGYAIFSTVDASAFGFTDSQPTIADLLAVNLADGQIRLISHAGATQSGSSMAQAAGFVKVVGSDVYFTANDATKLGFTSDGDAAKADLFRYNLETGAVTLLSHVASSSTQSLNGAYVANSLTVSADSRYVAFALDISASYGGFGIGVAGDGLFLVDTVSGAIRLVNSSNNTGTHLSYAAWGGTAGAPRFFTPDGSRFIWQTDGYLGWTQSDRSSSVVGFDDQWSEAVLMVDLSHGVTAAGGIQANHVLSHGAASSTQVASATLIGVSFDSRRAFFSAPNANFFGNAGRAFSDPDTAATDLFAVDLNTRLVDLLSGQNLQSLGSAASWVGTSHSGDVLFSVNNVAGVITNLGTLADGNGTGSDLLVRRYNLLDLNTDADSASGSSLDNTTNQTGYRVTAFAPPGMNVKLLDQGVVVAEQVANAKGRLQWDLTNVSSGTHVYSLLYPTEGVPVHLSSDIASNSLSVVVLNHAPTDISLSSTTVAENAGANALIGNLSTTDSDSSDTFTYALVAGSGDDDNAAFSIDGDQLHAIQSFDYESQAIYQVRIRSTDQGGMTTEKAFTITVSDVSEGAQINGTAGNDTIVATYLGDGITHAWSVKINNAAAFSASGNLMVDGLAGTDSLNIVGQTGSDVFSQYANRVIINGAIVQFSNTELVKSLGGLGNDSITVLEAADLGVIASYDGGGGSDYVETLTGTNSWRITASGVGTLNTAFSFLGVESIRGGAADDEFVFESNGKISGLLSGGGGTDTLNLSATTGSNTINLQTSTATLTGGISNIESFLGSSQTNVLDVMIGANSATNWTISGNNTGTITTVATGSSVTFSGFESLTGGSAVDVFVMLAAGSLSGNLNAGTGSDTLDLSAKNTMLDFQLAATNNSIPGSVGSYVGFELITANARPDSKVTRVNNTTTTWAVDTLGRIVVGGVIYDKVSAIVGGPGIDTLTGPALAGGAVTNWTLQSAGGGTLALPSATVTFAEMNDLTGAAGVDAFVILAAGSLSGNLNAGAGSDTLDLSDKTTALDFRLGATTNNIPGTVGGYVGFELITANALAGGRVTRVNNTTTAWAVDTLGRIVVGGVIYDKVSAIVGGPGTDTLTGPALAGGAVTNWTLQSAGGGTLALPSATVTFTEINNLTGGTGVDAFSLLAAGSISGSLNAGAGSDTLDLSAKTTALDFRLDTTTDSIPGTIGGYVGIELITANALADGRVTRVNNTTTAWAVDMLGRIVVGGVIYDKVSAIVGGPGIDTLTGPSLSGGAVTNWTLQSAGGGTLALPSAAVTFTEINNLTGGTGVDAFSLLAAGSISGSLNAGAGSDTLDLSAKTSALDFRLAATANSIPGSVGSYVGFELITANALADGRVTRVNNITTAWAVDTLGRIVVGGVIYDKVSAIVGGPGIDTLTGPALSGTAITDWTLHSAGGGTLTIPGATVTFAEMNNLTGGIGADSFHIRPNGSLSGNLSGGIGTGLNSLSYAEWSTAVTVNLSVTTAGNATNVLGAVTNMQLVVGGAGNDTLRGPATKSVILVGLAGNDTLVGGGQRDILSGGSGADSLTGGGGDDLLISGSTALDANRDALFSIYAEWLSSRTFSQRTANIWGNGSGVRANGNYFLNSNSSDDITDTVFADTDVDTLTGGLNQDWLFASVEDTDDWAGTGSSPDRRDR